MASIRTLALLIPSILLPVGAIAAQCNLDTSSIGIPGVPSSVYDSAMWDPDGPGPQSELVILVGDFIEAGTVSSDAVVAWDPTTGSFSAFPGAPSRYGRCVVVAANGDLIVGGDNFLVRWSGGVSTAIPLGAFIVNISSVAELPNGDLVVAGPFFSIGGISTPSVARWDGVAWHAMGPGRSGAYLVAAMPNGDVVAAGQFVGGNILRWDGTSWNALGAGLQYSVHSIAVQGNGEIAVESAGGFYVWDGASWGLKGSLTVGAFAIQGEARRIIALGNGAYVVAGRFDTVNNVAVGQITFFDGVAWHPVAPPLWPSTSTAYLSALQWTANGDLIAAGSFAIPGVATNVARFDGTSWLPLSRGLPERTTRVLARDDGTFLAAATPWLGTLGGLVVLNGTSVQAIGPSPDLDVNAMVMTANGDVILGGSFTAIGTNPFQHVARWDGTSWHPIGAGRPQPVYCLAELQNGHLIAGGTTALPGTSAVARWDGTTWTAVGAGLVAGGGGSSRVAAIVELPNGDLIAAGTFTLGGATRHIARYSGATWTPFGTDVNDHVNVIVQLPNGDIVIGGRFTAAGALALPHRVARWDGSTWHPVGTGTAVSYTEVHDLEVLPNGDLLAAGAFPFTITGGQVARWDGSVWTTLVSHPNGIFTDMAFDGNGTVVAVGYYHVGYKGGRVTWFSTDCPASATVVATPCVGPAGPMTSEVRQNPWLGSSYLAECDGFVAGALGASVLGFASPGVPLATFHPTGLPNCSLLADPVATLLLIPASGVAGLGFPIPDAAALIGVEIYHQFLQAEFSGGTMLSLSGSNGLHLTLGRF